MSYSSRDYKNPFFDKRPKVKRPRVKRVSFSPRARLATIIAAALFIVLFWWLLFSGYFTIKHIDIRGGERISPQSVKQIAEAQMNENWLMAVPQDNILLFRPGLLIDELERKYAFNELYVDKDWPDRLVISYDEKKYFLIWQEDDKFYYIDKHGYVINEVDILEVSQKDYPIVKNQSGRRIWDEYINVDTAYTDYAADLFVRFKEYPEYRIESFIVDKDIDTLKLQLKDGPRVYFNIRSDPAKQINKLLIIRNEKLKDEFNAKTYIDVRTGDAVYFR